MKKKKNSVFLVLIPNLFPLIYAVLPQQRLPSRCQTGGSGFKTGSAEQHPTPPPHHPRLSQVTKENNHVWNLSYIYPSVDLQQCLRQMCNIPALTRVLCLVYTCKYCFNRDFIYFNFFFFYYLCSVIYVV